MQKIETCSGENAAMAGKALVSHDECDVTQGFALVE